MRSLARSKAVRKVCQGGRGGGQAQALTYTDPRLFRSRRIRSNRLKACSSTMLEFGRHIRQICTTFTILRSHISHSSLSLSAKIPETRDGLRLTTLATQNAFVSGTKCPPLPMTDRLEAVVMCYACGGHAASVSEIRRLTIRKSRYEASRPQPRGVLLVFKNDPRPVFALRT